MTVADEQAVTVATVKEDIVIVKAVSQSYIKQHTVKPV